MGNVTALTLISDAFVDVGVIGEGQTPNNADSQRGLRILNRLCEQWSIIRQFATTRTLSTFSWAASQSSRTIGPTGNFVLTMRPIEILGATWIDTSSTPNVRIPVDVYPYSEYSKLSIPLLTATIMMELYYSPDTPNGTLYAYPTPTVTRSMVLETLTFFSTFATLATSADLAPGYEAAIIGALIEQFSITWKRPLADLAALKARDARTFIKDLNSKPPTISTDELNGDVDTSGSYLVGWWNK